MALLRPQQYRISWPLTPKGVEDIDTMFETLFKALRQASVAAAVPAAPVSSSGGLGDLGALLGQLHVASGSEGEDGDMGPPGVRGTTGATGATGAQGPQGYFIPGLDGEDGQDAPTIPGPQGPKGDTGSSGSGAGSMGPPGQDGTDGEDAATQFSYAPSDLARLSVQNTFSNTSGQIIQGPLNLSGASAGQIKFPATQNPSSDANTLDDYEEGTWTPNDASGAGLTFSTAFGTYTKIGRTVHAFFVVIYPATANGAAAVMGGLPFTAIAGNSGIGGSVVMTLTSFATLILGFIGSSATTSTFRTTGNVSINNSQLSTLFVSGTCVYDSA